MRMQIGPASTRRRVGTLIGLVVCGVLASACGDRINSTDAPTNATAEDFCLTYVQQATSIEEKAKASLTSNGELPTGDVFATVFREWAAEMVKVGTPADINADARAGFENVLEEAAGIEGDELDPEILLGERGDSSWGDLSGEEFTTVRAVNTYVQDTCNAIYRERGLM